MDKKTVLSKIILLHLIVDQMKADIDRKNLLLNFALEHISEEEIKEIIKKELDN